MKFSTRSAKVEFEVPFHDVDRVNIVWHGHYLRYFELARTALMRKLDLDVQDIIDLGFAMVVSESKCRHVSPARYGDRLAVTASITEVYHHINVGYIVENITSKTIAARGRTKLVCIGPDFSLIPKIPEEILDRLKV